jgi:hypothetical protein
LRDQIEADVIEVKSFTPTLSFPAPAATPEKVSEDAPFPYLLPLRGAQSGSVDADNGPIYVTFEGDEQPTLVATNSVRKNYHDIFGISNLQFVLEYPFGADQGRLGTLSRSLRDCTRAMP